MTLLNLATCYYLFIALVTGGICLVTFWRDTDTPKTDSICWIAIVIATLLWPVVLPLAGLERLSKQKAKLADKNPKLQNSSMEIHSPG